MEKPETEKVAADSVSAAPLPKTSPLTSTTLTVVRFYPEPERWDFSPWVNRLEALLTFSGCPYEIASTLPPLAPRGRLPVLRLREGSKKEIIPDSLFGYNELVKRGMARELDVGLTPEDLAKSRTIQSLLEEIFLFWVKEGWVEQYYTARDKVVLYSLPWPARLAAGYYMKQRVSASRCELSGFSFKRPESEVDEVRQTAVDALAIWVGEKRYVLGGDSPTRADAAIFGFLVSAYAHPQSVLYLNLTRIASSLVLTILSWLPKLAAAMKTHSNLQRYAEGLRKTWYPDRPSFV
ncbi:hypothetical protein DL93DRAFT_2058798 [Clavulina sp. PMI_390]|nr:hypothetical protein DL93DRAFT_2058798 [Clavulina sp. PMI_390]